MLIAQRMKSAHNSLFMLLRSEFLDLVYPATMTVRLKANSEIMVIRSGALYNIVLINLVALVLIGLPLAATRNEFSVPNDRNSID